MESEITIELEQSFASVVRYIQNKADNNAALYFDDLPEAFAVPSLYFPVPRTDTKKVTFSTYLTTLYLDTWFMEATDWQAYADAATVRDSLMMDECKVRVIRLEIGGQGSINVSGSGVSKEKIVDAMMENLRDVFMNIVQQEIIEEGEGAYEF